MSSAIVEVEIWSDDVVPVYLNTLENAFDIQYLEELNGPGGGSFTINRYDPKVADSGGGGGLLYGGILAKRNIVRIKVDNVYRGAFVISKTDLPFVEETGQANNYVVSGEGLRTLFQDAILYPEKGDEGLTDIQTRMFNFASDRSGYTWYKPAEWTVPTHCSFQKTLTTGNPWRYRPTEWPDVPNASWIWDRWANVTAPVGDVYFRREFTLLTGGDFTIFMSCDNSFEAFMDGQPLGESGGTWTKTDSFQLTLPAGFHTFAVRGTNTGGPAALIACMFRNGSSSADGLADLIWNTVGNSSWRVNGYPAKRPGWTLGEVMWALQKEATDRGVRSFQRFTKTYSTSKDSYGLAWATSFEWMFDIGSSYDSLVERFEEVAGDVWVNPADFSINVYNTQGYDRTTDVNVVAFNPVVNLRTANEEREADFKTVALVRSATKWLSRVSSSALASYGRIEMFVPAGDEDLDYIATVGDKTLQSKMVESRSVSYVIEPTLGNVPWKDFGIGDWVLFDAKQSAQYERRRVASIAMSMDASGTITYALELDTPERTKQALLDRWIKSVSLGTAGHGFAVASNVAVRIPPTRKKFSVAQLESAVAEIRTPAPPLVPPPVVLPYTDPAGVPKVQADFSWPAVDTSIDGDTQDIARYEIQYQVSGTNTWVSAPSVDHVPDAAQTIQVVGLQPGVAYTFRIRSVAYNGNFSDWNDLTTSVVPPTVDITPPAPPTGPVLEPSVDTIVVKWDGYLESGSLPEDFSRVRLWQRVQGSTVAAEQVAELIKGQSYTATKLLFGISYEFYFTSLDVSGNQSRPGASTFGTTRGMPDPTIPVGSITLELLATDVQHDLLTARRLIVGGKNYLVDPKFLDSDVNAARVTGTGVTVDAPSSTDASGGLRFTTEGQTVVLRTEVGNDFPIVAEPLRQYVSQVEVSEISGMTFDLAAVVQRADGTTVSYPLVTAGNAVDRWNGNFYAPSDAAFFGVQVVAHGTGTLVVQNPFVGAMTGSTEISDGAVTADKVVANFFDGVVMTGSTVQTRVDDAASGIRFDGDSFRAWNDLGTTTFSIDADTGDTLMTGKIQTALPGTVPRALVDKSTVTVTDTFSAGNYRVTDTSASGAWFELADLTTNSIRVLNKTISDTVANVTTVYVPDVRFAMTSSNENTTEVATDLTKRGTSYVELSGLSTKRTAKIGVAGVDPVAGRNSLNTGTNDIYYDWAFARFDTNGVYMAATDKGVSMYPFPRNTATLQITNSLIHAESVTYSGGAADQAASVDIDGVTGYVGMENLDNLFRLTTSGGGAQFYIPKSRTVPSFQVHSSGTFQYGRMYFRPGNATTGSGHVIFQNNSTDFRFTTPDIFSFEQGTVGGGDLCLVMRQDGRVEWRKLPSSTGTANLFVVGTNREMRFVSSLSEEKLDQQPIALHPEILDMQPKTWVDRHAREEDPEYDKRFAGFVAQDLDALSTEHGGMFEALIVRNEDGSLQSIAYDRITAYLIPVIRDLAQRVAVLEGA